MLLSKRAQRMAQHHARRGRASLNMVSLMDIFTILVFFLLFSSTEEVQVLPEPRDMALPESIAEAAARETLLITVSAEELRLDGEFVVRVEDVLARDEQLIPELALAFTDRVTSDSGAGSEVTIMGERTLPYVLLRRIMSTAGAAEFERIALAVRQRGDGVRGAVPSRDGDAEDAGAYGATAYGAIAHDAGEVTR